MHTTRKPLPQTLNTSTSKIRLSRPPRNQTAVALSTLSLGARSDCGLNDGPSTLPATSQLTTNEL